MDFVQWFILAIAILLFLFLAVVGFFCKFAIFRTKERKKPEKEHIETEFERMYMPRIRAGIKWFKDQSPERLWLKSHDGLKLAADYLPAENAVGTIIVVHGYRSNNCLDFSCVFELYHSWNYNILAVHDRAHGDSEGKYIGFGILDRYDVLAWTEYVTENIGGSVFLDGMSMGASTVLMTSGFDLPKNVKGIIADCGFTSPFEECKHVLKKDFKLPAFPLLPICSLGVKLFAGYSLNDYSTLDALKTNKIPVLFIHGSEDTFVPTYMGKQNYDACVAEKEILIIDGANHGESFLKETERCTAVLKNFLDKYTE